MVKPIEIEGPDLLGKNQNFYEQDPYLSIPQDIKLDPDQTRILITRITSKSKRSGIDLNQASSLGKGFKAASPEEKRKRIEGAKARFKQVTEDLKVPRTTVDQRAMAGLIIARHLSRFPLIWRYTQTQFDDTTYRINGSVKNTYFAAITPSYANWASRQIELQDKLVTVGIDEVFPRGIEPARIVDATVTLGTPNPVNRRWRILNASEITRKS